MIYQKDFRDLCALLNKAKIEYLIVGGYAVAFHGSPRFTGDFDILIRPDREHAEMLNVLERFGFPANSFSAEDVLTHHRMIQLGHIPVQIHLMTGITGVSWAEAWQSREQGAYGDVPVYFLGRAARMANKTAAARPKDLANVHALLRKTHP